MGRNYAFAGFLGALVLTWGPSLVAADSVTVVRDGLPQGFYGSATVASSRFVYVIGGDESAPPTSSGPEPYSRPILRFDPEMGTTRQLDAELPLGLVWASAVWTGSKVYVFGGRNELGLYVDQILEFDPATTSVSLLAAKLPSPRYSTSAIWDSRDRPADGCPGGCAYIFGGFTGAQNLAEIVKFNPSQNTVAVLKAELPTARSGVRAVWDEESATAYLIGGGDASGTLSEIVAFTAQPARATQLPAALPSRQERGAVVWNGESAYWFGGVEFDGRGWLGEIIRFSPAQGTVEVMDAALPTGRGAASAAWINGSAYVFGGYDGSRFYEEVLQYRLVPGAIMRIQGERASCTNVAILDWDPPATNTYEGEITGHRIHRTVDGDGPVEVFRTGAVTAFTDRLPRRSVDVSYALQAVNEYGEGRISTEFELPAMDTTACPRAFELGSTGLQGAFIGLVTALVLGSRRRSSGP